MNHASTTVLAHEAALCRTFCMAQLIMKSHVGLSTEERSSRHLLSAITESITQHLSFNNSRNRLTSVQYFARNPLRHSLRRGSRGSVWTASNKTQARNAPIVLRVRDVPSQTILKALGAVQQSPEASIERKQECRDHTHRRTIQSIPDENF